MALTVPVAEIVERSKNPLLGKAESWGRVLLGDIATIQNGFAFKSSDFSKDAGMPLIRIRDVGKDSTDTRYVGEFDPAYVVNAGDLLVGMDGDFNCARWHGGAGLLNQRVCRISLTSDIYHPKLLDYALPGYLKAINEMTSSVTVKHLSSKSIAQIPLPLPPMEQQESIVTEIEKQFSRLDEAVANLKRVKANLKRYKAAVLKAAVTGELTKEWRAKHASKLDAQGGANAAGGRKPGAVTEEWRAAHGCASVAGGHDSMDGGGRVKQDARAEEPGATKAHPDVEPASKLLDRILAERRAKWEEAELAKMEAKGKAPKNDKWKAKYKGPSAPETNEMFELPDGWVLASVGELCFLDSGEAFKKRDYSIDGLRLLQIANVGFGQVLWEQQNFLPESFGEKHPELLMRAGDIVLSLNRPIIAEQLKVAVLSEKDLPAILYQRVGRLRPVGDANPAYLFAFFQSPNMLAAVRNRLQGTDQPYLNTSLVPGIAMPLPPAVEQRRIVAEVDRRLSLIHEIEIQVNTNLQRAERLRQSLLAHVFSGKACSAEGPKYG